MEISTDIQVLGNTVERAPNGLNASRMNWCYGGGILIATSYDVLVAGNTVADSVHGILVIDQSHRGDTPAGYDARDYVIEGNTVSDVNKVGACEDVGSPAIFEGVWSGNVFERVQTLLRPL